MGWFLTRNRNKRQPKRKQRRRASAARPKPWNPQRTLMVLELLGIFAVIGGLVAAWRVSEQALVDYAEQHRARGITIEQVILHDAPRWMTAPTRRQIAERVVEVVQPDMLEGRSLHRAAEVLLQDPWVQRVRQVRRLADGRIVIEADYRIPVAVVESKLGHVLVDVEGVRLPGVYQADQVDLLQLPRITGIATEAPAEPGQTWQGDDMHAVLSLIGLLAGEPYVQQVRTFEVRRTELGRLRLALITAEGEVQWGYPPGLEETIEPSWRVKVERLRRLHASYSTISAGRAVVEIYGAAVQGWGESTAAAGNPADYTSVQ